LNSKLTVHKKLLEIHEKVIMINLTVTHK